MTTTIPAYEDLLGSISSNLCNAEDRDREIAQKRARHEARKEAGDRLFYQPDGNRWTWIPAEGGEEALCGLNNVATLRKRPELAEIRRKGLSAAATAKVGESVEVLDDWHPRHGEETATYVRVI